MADLNWLLMAIAFALGVVLTLAFTLRRVTREVPVSGSGKSASLAGGAGVAGAKAKASGGATAAAKSTATAPLPKVTAKGAGPDAGEASTAVIKKPDLDAPTAVIKTAADDSPTAVIRKVADAEVDSDGKAVLPPGPHGQGTASPNDDGSGPTGWDVKGNEESMLYHSTESPSYGVTRAEVWFRDVESAEAAGFNRWDSGKSQRGRK